MQKIVILLVLLSLAIVISANNETIQESTNYVQCWGQCQFFANGGGIRKYEHFGSF